MEGQGRRSKVKVKKLQKLDFYHRSSVMMKKVGHDLNRFSTGKRSSETQVSYTLKF